MHLSLDKHHFDAAIEEECAKDIKDPIQPGNEGNAQSNHHAAHDKGSEDAPIQDAMLILRGNAEISEERDNQENVIHRERKLDKIAGEKLQGFLVSAQRSEAERKEHRQGKPNRSPDERPAEFYDMGLPMENTEIECEKDKNAGDESNPMPSGDFNQGKH